MTHQEFKQQICQALQSALGSQVRVTVQDIVKNNNTHLSGLTVLSDRCNVSPTIYLDPYYRKYQNGTSLSDICEEILNVYQENQPTDSIDVSFFTDYDRIKSRIVFKLVNYEKNGQLLKDIPYYRFLDLAVVFNCLLEYDSNGSATILIRNQHMKFWNITADDLYALAMQNTPALLKYDLRNMTEILKEFLTETEFEELSSYGSHPCTMYMLSNRLKLNGSVCILYPDLLKSFAEHIQSDLYILPSSVHEVLLLPADGQSSSQELSDMVREVNHSQLSREEILSDHIYYYSRDTCQITM